MKTKSYIKGRRTVFIPAIAFILMVSCALAGECAGTKPLAFDSQKYYNDRAPVNNIELPVLVNKTTGQVEYFWDDDNDAWVRAERHTSDLQNIYENRDSIRKSRQLKGMQKEMDRERQDSWFQKKDQ